MPASSSGLPMFQQESAHLHICGHVLLPSTPALKKQWIWSNVCKEQCLTVFSMDKEFLEIDGKGGGGESNRRMTKGDNQEFHKEKSKPTQLR